MKTYEDTINKLTDMRKSVIDLHEQYVETRDEYGPDNTHTQVFHDYWFESERELDGNIEMTSFIFEVSRKQIHKDINEQLYA